MRNKKLKLSFSGHETFPFRYTWLKKAVDAVTDNPHLFKEEYAMSELGVGKNMVKSIRHWGLLAGILEEGNESGTLTVSEFGYNLLSDDGWDPYLEDTASLWLIHWNICKNIEGSTTWFYAFNRLTSIEFTKEQLVDELLSFAESNQTKVTTNTIRRDVDCLIRTYVPSKNVKPTLLEDSLDCPLNELSLIQEAGNRGLYIFLRGQKQEIHNELFIYMLLDYWDNLENPNNTITFDEIAYKAGCPGLILKIDEDSLAYILESIENITNGDLKYDETSNLKQVYREEYIDKNRYLEKYYKQSAITLTA